MWYLPQTASSAGSASEEISSMGPSKARCALRTASAVLALVFCDAVRAKRSGRYWVENSGKRNKLHGTGLSAGIWVAARHTWKVNRPSPSNTSIMVGRKEAKPMMTNLPTEMHMQCTFRDPRAHRQRFPSLYVYTHKKAGMPMAMHSAHGQPASFSPLECAPH